MTELCPPNHAYGHEDIRSPPYRRPQQQQMASNFLLFVLAIRKPPVALYAAPTDGVAPPFSRRFTSFPSISLAHFASIERLPSARRDPISVHGPNVARPWPRSLWKCIGA